ncbi:IS110 family transposase [Legionella waltersii]|uniref:Transposase, IS116/IS110/IS902 n=1 Tax=Legionella waltersii TaxID=66969 RepID=A0A0W1A0E4_9GAMM|nr:IS110 family transposase [Legionella waltersii]KTD74811.1 Transposase, IS116/IS110/IS902 [Legionella waltersii]SNU97215.1 Transposase, IS116/IS110/IS902 [Legionella waltersii]SNU97434.1 Transposase, IS116/IS110/IS902 [Legionella waltersii]SNU97582.1 Transposase, IS116/IS110/IS902 [Legionella waltersii]SNV00894.1 Transposase, IS116/IS110/IS902 [Legionella waltersii]
MKKSTRTTPLVSKGISKTKPIPKHLEQINQWAAGIDIGATSHFVAVPEGCTTTSVREFKSFTPDLYSLAEWLKECGIQTIAMESTGVYWIPVYELLEEKGFEVKLVDARQVKNVSGRKTDVLDCQWIQQLHTYGLLNGAFRPDNEICALRTYVRQRSMLIRSASRYIQQMQKALTQMNLQLHHVITDITGDTGMRIIRAIINGEREAAILATNRDPRCKSSKEDIEAALTGNYREEHLFSLKQSLELYDYFQEKIKACDDEIEKCLSGFSTNTLGKDFSVEKPKSNKKKVSKNAPAFNLGGELYRLTGVDLLAVPGINNISALQLLSEVGFDMTRWKNSKQFSSWLGLCPGNKVSGGKRLSGKTKPSNNKAAATLRMAASTLYRSQTSLGAYLRRLKSRIGPMKAITATAHKLAIIIYNMLRHGVDYIESGQDYYDEKYRKRMIKNLKRKAAEFGMSLIENQINFTPNIN